MFLWNHRHRLPVGLQCQCPGSSETETQPLFKYKTGRNSTHLLELFSQWSGANELIYAKTATLSWSAATAGERNREACRRLTSRHVGNNDNTFPEATFTAPSLIISDILISFTERRSDMSSGCAEPINPVSECSDTHNSFISIVDLVPSSNEQNTREWYVWKCPLKLIETAPVSLRGLLPEKMPWVSKGARLRGRRRQSPFSFR